MGIIQQIGIELDFRRIHEIIAVGNTRHDLIEILNEIDDAFRNAARESQVYITQNISFVRQRRLHTIQMFGTFGMHEIVVCLQDNFILSSQDIGKLSDVRAVSHRIVEWLRKLNRSQDGKIGVFAFFIHLGMSVHRDEILVIFRYHITAGIIAKSANHVAGFAQEFNFEFVHFLIQIRHNVIG